MKTTTQETAGLAMESPSTTVTYVTGDIPVDPF
jgi:hypothetical protein